MYKNSSYLRFLILDRVAAHNLTLISASLKSGNPGFSLGEVHLWRPEVSGSDWNALSRATFLMALCLRCNCFFLDFRRFLTFHDLSVLQAASRLIQMPRKLN